METERFILVHHYCEHTQIPVDFIYSLQEFGFIKIKEIENSVYIQHSDLVEIERINRLQDELGINLEGIDAIKHIMEKMNRLENEVRTLKNRLKIYEP